MINWSFPNDEMVEVASGVEVPICISGCVVCFAERGRSMLVK
jgi:hypothetical protein